MKEHEHPYWEKGASHRSSEDKDPYTAGNFDYKLGHRHAREGNKYSPPRTKHESSYEQGYNSKD